MLDARFRPLPKWTERCLAVWLIDSILWLAILYGLRGLWRLL